MFFPIFNAVIFCESVTQHLRLGVGVGLSECEFLRRTDLKRTLTRWLNVLTKSEGLSIVSTRSFSRGGSTLGQQKHVPPRFTCCPSDSKALDDRSDVISEVPKCSKIQIFWGSARNPHGGGYSAPQTP